MDWIGPHVRLFGTVWRLHPELACCDRHDNGDTVGDEDVAVVYRLVAPVLGAVLRPAAKALIAGALSCHSTLW